MVSSDAGFVADFDVEPCKTTATIMRKEISPRRQKVRDMGMVIAGV